MTDKKNMSLRKVIGVLAVLLLAATTFTASACGDSADEETNNDTTNNVTQTDNELGLRLRPGVTISNDGSDVVDTVDGAWEYDETHSNIRFETAYHGKNALVTGQFGTTQIDIKFDQNDLANSSIEAAVELSSIFTGEPGRDGLGGCLMKSFGVMVEQIDGEWALADESTNVATFKSTSIEKKGDGYVAKGTLDFKGVQDEVELVFGYTGSHAIEAHSGPILESGFTGEFTFKANSIFGVDSDSINDNVTILVDVIFATPNE